MDLDLWNSFHLYYHEDLTRALLNFVHPLVTSLLRTGEVDRFYFVRYGLGGPHLRLRLRSCAGMQQATRAKVEEAALRFLVSCPSTQTRDEENLRREAESLLAQDPYETDDTIYPDNFLLHVPFSPEVDRYGGLEYLGASLDFFTLSSVESIRFTENSVSLPRSRQLVGAFRLLLRQALGFSSTPQELTRLLDYGVQGWGSMCASAVAKAEQVFQAQQDAFLSLFQSELGSLRQPRLFDEAAWRLSRELGSVAELRFGVGVNHLHMTANRLGLINPEEVYLSYLLVACCRGISEQQQGAWQALEEALAARKAARPRFMDYLVFQSLEYLR